MELTDEQADTIVHSIPAATPMVDRRAIVRGVWKACSKLFRDQVLEEAAKACESLATVDGQVIPGLRNELDCAAGVRAMKGSP